MKLLEPSQLFLVLCLRVIIITGSTNKKCKNWSRKDIVCSNLNSQDYPLWFPPSNETFNLRLIETANLPNFSIGGIKIEKLVISESNITNIDINAFSGHEDTLKILEISTIAKKIPFQSKPVENLYNLEKLKIFNFVLNRKFNQMDFSNLTKLQSLHLEYNGLLFFDTAFQGLTSLKTLIIRNNHFTNIPLPPIFEHLQNLTVLDMSDNNINKITGYNLQYSKNLKELILEQNEIVEIEIDAFKGIENTLEVLDLKLNRLNSTQLIKIGTILSLKKLNLQFNRILELPKGMFQNLKFLEVLNLKNNKLSIIKNGNFFGLVNLKTLQLDNNDLIVEAGTLLDTRQLEEISFKQQTKDSLKMEWLKDVGSSLLKLYLDRNTFNKSSLWDAIQSLQKLEYLSLSNCKLQSIPDFAFEQNRQLQTLKLDGNNLQVLRPETFRGLQESIKSISLDENALETIDECVFEYFNWNLKQNDFPLKLFNNNLICNCSILWLQEWIQNYLNQSGLLYTYVQAWKCVTAVGLSEAIFQANITCGLNSTNSTCPDFKYTTMILPTTINTLNEITSTVSPSLDMTTKETSTLPSTTLPLPTSTTLPLPTSTTLPLPTSTTLPLPTSTTLLLPTTTKIVRPVPQIPKLVLLLEKLSSSSVSIFWNISDWKHVQNFLLVIEKSENLSTLKNRIVLSKMDPNTKTLTNLKQGTILGVCLQLKLDFPSKILEQCDTIHLIKAQKVKGENVGVKIGIGVGVAILVTLIFILIGVVCHSRRKSKDMLKRTGSKGSLSKPKMTANSKRYEKRKTQHNVLAVSVISTEPFQPMPRISAGSYQYLADPNLASNSLSGSYDNRAFTQSISNMTECIENNNHENPNKSTTTRPLPNVPGSQNLQYFQLEEPIYVNVQPHYAEIPNPETII